MKLPIKLIATLVILSLVGIFSYQAYWLTDLYGTLRKELESKIVQSISRSDYNEMVCRIQLLQKNNEKSGRIEASVGYDSEADSSFIQTKSTLEGDEEADYVNSSTATLQASPFGMVIKQNNNLEVLLESLQRGVHTALDNYIPLNVQVFDSLLTLALHDDGITTPHRTQLINLRDSLVEATVSNDTLYVPSAQALSFDHVITMNGKYCYRVQLEPIDSIIWKQMTGILVTSLAIMLLLGFSFYYLIRTLLRQKTIEELKSDFTNNITHELKTPIAVAYAATDALLNFEQTEEKRKEYLQISQKQLKHLSGLIEQILSMSMEHRKNFRLHPETVHVQEMIESLIQLHQLKADKPVEFIAKYSAANITVKADRVHLYNILSNLLDNAIKYSHSSVQITLSVWKNKESVTISVADNGIGIPADKLERIFDRFYRVPTGNLHEVKGYGLGLYYVKTMIGQHGGTVFVQSTPGKGSEFTLQIPE